MVVKYVRQSNVVIRLWILITAISFFGIACASDKSERSTDMSAFARKQQTGPKKRIALVQFSDDTKGNLGSVFYKVIDKLLRTEASVLLMPADDIRQSALNKPADVLILRDTLGANAVITGNIQSTAKLNNGNIHASVRLLVYSTASGELVASIVGTAELAPNQKDAYKKAIQEAAKDLSERLLRILKNKIRWSAAVKEVTPDGVLIIGAGSADGIRVGDVLVVRSEGTLITDTETGEVIGRETGTEKGNVEIKEILGMHLSRASVISGSGFKQGDVVYNF